jgi:hypothetical protein
VLIWASFKASRATLFKRRGADLFEQINRVMKRRQSEGTKLLEKK